MGTGCSSSFKVQSDLVHGDRRKLCCLVDGDNQPEPFAELTALFDRLRDAGEHNSFEVWYFSNGRCNTKLEIGKAASFFSCSDVRMQVCKTATSDSQAADVLISAKLGAFIERERFLLEHHQGSSPRKGRAHGRNTNSGNGKTPHNKTRSPPLRKRLAGATRRIAPSPPTDRSDKAASVPQALRAHQPRAGGDADNGKQRLPCDFLLVSADSDFVELTKSLDAPVTVGPAHTLTGVTVEILGRGGFLGPVKKKAKRKPRTSLSKRQHQHTSQASAQQQPQQQSQGAQASSPSLAQPSSSPAQQHHQQQQQVVRVSAAQPTQLRGDSGAGDADGQHTELSMKMGAISDNNHQHDDDDEDSGCSCNDPPKRMPPQPAALLTHA